MFLFLFDSLKFEHFICPFAYNKAQMLTLRVAHLSNIVSYNLFNQYPPRACRILLSAVFSTFTQLIKTSSFRIWARIECLCGQRSLKKIILKLCLIVMFNRAMCNVHSGRELPQPQRQWPLLVRGQKSRLLPLPYLSVICKLAWGVISQTKPVQKRDKWGIG